MAVWPEVRPVGYDGDKVWDETTGTWIANDGRGGGRYQLQIIVVNDQGQVYVGTV